MLLYPKSVWATLVAKDIMKSIDEMKSRHNMFVGEPTPNAKQIYYVSERQISAETPHMISIGDVVAWCQNNETVPMDDDAPFVIGYEHSSEDEHRWFRFMFSTQRLLKNAIGVTTLCIDATYNVNWHGYPFVIIGTVDEMFICFYSKDFLPNSTDFYST